MWLFHVRTMKPSEVKRKAMTSLAYGPYPITSLIPWKKDMGSDLGREDSEKKRHEGVNQDAEFTLKRSDVPFLAQ